MRTTHMTEGEGGQLMHTPRGCMWDGGGGRKEKGGGRTAARTRPLGASGADPDAADAGRDDMESGRGRSRPGPPPDRGV
jgi:hypothetical protein